MIRWMILAVLVVGVTTAATLTVQYLPADVNAPIPAVRSETGANAGPTTGPPPKPVVAEDTTHEFGTMSEEDVGTISWTVRNEGQGPLKMRFVESPCTCTSVRFGEDGPDLQKGVPGKDEYVIAPGDEADLYLTWETRDLLGNYRTFARFVTNAPDQLPSITFAVEGEVVEAIQVVPPSVEFPAAPSDEPTTTSVVLYSASHPNLQIVGSPRSSRPDLLTAEVKPMPEEQLATAPIEGLKAAYEVVITLKPGMPLGNFRDLIQIQTDHPVEPEVEIPVSGHVVGPITATPEGVHMIGVFSDQGQSRFVTLNVRNQDQTHFDVRLPDEVQDVLDVSIEPVETSSSSTKANFRQYRMTVSVPPGAAPGSYRGVIVLQTDHPKAKEVKVPFNVLVRSR